jgi:hypothetical protein
MDKEQALHSFWSSFGWAAYDENTVPDDAAYPYITYEVATGNLGKPVFLSAALWDRTRSWKSVTEKGQEIGDHIGYGGTTIRFDDGLMFITQGTPFAQRLPSEDDYVRRNKINIEAEFYSAV